MNSNHQLKIYLLFGMLFPLTVFAQSNEHTISVQGQGRIKVENTVGMINLSVITVKPMADEALGINSNLMNTIINELKGVGIEGDDITTTQFSLYPKYSWQNNTEEFVGYQVTNGIDVKVEQVSLLGAVLDLVTVSGATRVNSVRFDNASLTSIKQQALIEATADAKVKAELLASSTGVQLGDPIKISLQTLSSYGPIDPAADGFSSSNVPLSPGNSYVTETVNVTYAIEK